MTDVWEPLDDETRATAREKLAAMRDIVNRKQS